jgi:hypothetical protein
MNDRVMIIRGLKRNVRNQEMPAKSELTKVEVKESSSGEAHTFNITLKASGK